ncbi:unnamed protein product [Lathyrus oleraceus]
MMDRVQAMYYQGEPVNLLVMRGAPSRQKKKRNKANDGPSSSNVLPRHLTTVKCKSCGNFGHNLRTCKAKTMVDRQLPKGINKANKQNRDSIKEPPTVLTQVSQAPQTQD